MLGNPKTLIYTDNIHNTELVILIDGGRAHNFIQKKTGQVFGSTSFIIKTFPIYGGQQRPLSMQVHAH